MVILSILATIFGAIALLVSVAGFVVGTTEKNNRTFKFQILTLASLAAIAAVGMFYWSITLVS